MAKVHPVDDHFGREAVVMVHSIGVHPSKAPRCSGLISAQAKTPDCPH